MYINELNMTSTIVIRFKLVSLIV